MDDDSVTYGPSTTKQKQILIDDVSLVCGEEIQLPMDDVSGTCGLPTTRKRQLPMD